MQQNKDKVILSGDTSKANTDKKSFDKALAQKNAERILKMLGLAARARKLVPGTELSCDSVRSGKARLVLIAHNASQNTKKRLTNCCTYYECEFVEIQATTEQLGRSIGKSGLVGAVTLCDMSFVKGIKKILSVPAAIEKNENNTSSGGAKC